MVVINNTFQALQDQLKQEETTIDNYWKKIQNALTSKFKEMLVPKKHHHEKISIDILVKVQEKKDRKTAINSIPTRAE